MLKQLQAIVGVDHVSDEPGACDLATSDIFEWPGRKPALMVARPGTTDETSAILRVLREYGIAVIPRGAGLSYTGTFVTKEAAVVVDMLRMNDIEVNADDRYAIVGGGASWTNVAAALKPFGMMATQISPISGAYSTVGGLASQGIPAGLDGILGVDGGAGGRLCRADRRADTLPSLCGAGCDGSLSRRLRRVRHQNPGRASDCAGAGDFASFGFDDVDNSWKA